MRSGSITLNSTTNYTLNSTEKSKQLQPQTSQYHISPYPEWKNNRCLNPLVPFLRYFTRHGRFSSTLPFLPKVSETSQSPNSHTAALGIHQKRMDTDLPITYTSVLSASFSHAISPFLRGRYQNSPTIKAKPPRPTVT
ncbi:hypothetical protein VTJ04DRAFT_10693 [Mycothermus thermophilus]|uniref:uncharacterized protein n=1 Tax=Humicola insolens TaxID=85995 RepID=UPI0037424FB7